MLKIIATGLCHSDLSAYEGKIPVPTPFVAGHEIFGEIVDIGEGVTNFSVGDRVIMAFIKPCGKCEYCVKGQENLCENYGKNVLRGKMLDGTTRLRLRGAELNILGGGGFSEYAVIEETGLAKVPNEISDESIAVLGCAGLTGYGAVNNAMPIFGKRVMVIGVGGVGMSVIQWAKIAGAREIIAVDISDEKLKNARELGAKIINSNITSKEQVENESPDVVIEVAGTTKTEEMAVNVVKKGGKVVFVGLPNVNEAVRIYGASVVRKGITITGSYGGRPRIDLPAMMEYVKKGIFRPDLLVSKRYSLEELPRALRDLAEGRIVRGLINP